MQLSTRSNDCWSAQFFCHGHNRISSNKSCKLWTLWSQPFCCRPQGETLGVIDTSFWNSSERTQQQTLYFLPMVRMLFLPKGLWSLIRLTSFPNTCFSTCLMMSSVVQLVSDFVFTPTLRFETATWKSKQLPHMWPVWYWWCPRWAACFFPLHKSPHDFSP